MSAQAASVCRKWRQDELLACLLFLAIAIGAALFICNLILSFLREAGAIGAWPIQP